MRSHECAQQLAGAASALAQPWRIPDGRDVEHAVTEFDEGSTLDGDVQVGNVPQNEVDQRLELGLTKVLEE